MPRRTQKSEKEAERYALTERTITENASLDGGFIGRAFDDGGADIRHITIKPVPAYSTKQLSQKDQLLLAAGAITFQEVKGASMVDRRGVLHHTSKAMAGYNGLDIVSEFSMNLGDVRSMTILLNRFQSEKNTVYSFTLDGSEIDSSFPDTQRGAMMLFDRPVLDVHEIAEMCNGRRGDFAMRISGKSVMFDLHQYTEDGKLSGNPDYPDITSSFGMIPVDGSENDIGCKRTYEWKYCIYRHAMHQKSAADADIKNEYMFHKLLLRSVLSYFGIVPELMVPTKPIDTGDEVEEKIA